MFNKMLFLGMVKAAGYSLTTLAAELSMNNATLYRKVNGISDFTRSEIQSIRRILGLDTDMAERIFFAMKSA